MEDIFINYIEDYEIKVLNINKIYDNSILDLIKFKNLKKLDCSFIPNTYNFCTNKNY